MLKILTFYVAVKGMLYYEYVAYNTSRLVGCLPVYIISVIFEYMDLFYFLWHYSWEVESLQKIKTVLFRRYPVITFSSPPLKRDTCITFLSQWMDT